VRPEIKFCGLTRREDAEAAASLGAAYAGAIFAGGPRNLTPKQAADVLDGVGGALKKVGVFAEAVPDAIASIADAVQLDIIQLHGGATPDAIDAVRRRTGRQVWAVMRIAGTEIPPELNGVASAADAVLVDAHVDGSLGGTGVALPWRALAPALRRAVNGHRLVLAGGLTPENVRKAISEIAPDVVDVSSGVESAPGTKDHTRMRAFAQAVRR
jgi:phosphoribosylanthranilate isomerase